MKTKTTAAATIAALAVPGVALADKPDSTPAKGGHSADHRQDAKAKSKQKAKKGKAKVRSRAFVVKGVDFGGLQLTDGALAGTLTLDPTSANKHARKLLELTKAELRGEDTVTFGEAGDKVRVKYEGLQSTDAIQPTDVVKVIGKVKGGEVDIRKIQIKRETETEDDES